MNSFNYSKNTFEIDLMELKQLLGLYGLKGYATYGLLNQKVLTPAIKEINEKTEFKAEFRPVSEYGKKVTRIRFNFKKKVSSVFDDEEETATDVQTVIKPTNLAVYGSLFGLGISFDKVTELYQIYTEDKIVSAYNKFLEVDSLDIGNKAGYLLSILKGEKVEKGVAEKRNLALDVKNRITPERFFELNKSNTFKLDLSTHCYNDKDYYYEVVEVFRVNGKKIYYCPDLDDPELISDTQSKTASSLAGRM